MALLIPLEIKLGLALFLNGAALFDLVGDAVLLAADGALHEEVFLTHSELGRPLHDRRPEGPRVVERVVLGLPPDDLGQGPAPEGRHGAQEPDLLHADDANVVPESNNLKAVIKLSCK